MKFSIFRLHRASVLLVAALAGAVSASPVTETPQTQTAWTPASLRDTLSELPSGDAARGQLVHDRLFCASCHGPAGVSPTLNWPHLAGQKANYTAKMLLDYQSGLRREGRRAELMHDIAVMLTPQDIADVAAFYAAQPAPREAHTPRPGSQSWEGVAAYIGPQRMASEQPSSAIPARQLVRMGDPKRLITPCASCHGVSGQGGPREAPALAGQNPLYFVRTMLVYQTGQRANDSLKGMQVFAHRLTREEMESLAAYYADLPAGKK